MICRGTEAAASGGWKFALALGGERGSLWGYWAWACYGFMTFRQASRACNAESVHGERTWEEWCTFALVSLCLESTILPKLCCWGLLSKEDCRAVGSGGAGSGVVMEGIVFWRWAPGGLWKPFHQGSWRQRAALQVLTGRERHGREMGLPWVCPGDWALRMGGSLGL